MDRFVDDGSLDDNLESFLSPDGADPRDIVGQGGDVGKGSARTSLIITIGPSARHHAETSSTIMFGQRAMEIVNMVKLKEEFDYESLCRKLESQVDNLTAEIERQQRLRDNDKDEVEKKLIEYQNSSAEAEKKLVTRSEV